MNLICTLLIFLWCIISLMVETFQDDKGQCQHFIFLYIVGCNVQKYIMLIKEIILCWLRAFREGPFFVLTQQCIALDRMNQTNSLFFQTLLIIHDLPLLLAFGLVSGCLHKLRRTPKEGMLQFLKTFQPPADIIKNGIY